MAASVASNDSAVVNTITNTGGEKGDTVMQVTKSSPEVPRICLDHKNVGHEDANSSTVGPCSNATAVTLAGCGSYDQSNYIPFTDMVVEAVRKTQITDDIVSRSVCQTGDDVHKNVCGGCGSSGIEFSSQPVKFAESKTDASVFVCTCKQIVTEEAESSLFHTIVTEQTQEAITSQIILEGSEHQCIDLEQEYIFKSDASHDNSFSDNFSVNITYKNTVAELKSAHEKSELIAKNSFGDSDIQSEVITENTKLINMNSTLEEVKLKSEIGHGDTLGGNKNETLDTDLSEMTSNINSFPVSEASCVRKEQDLVENMISGKELFEMKPSKEESTGNCSDSILDNVNKSQVKISPEIKSVGKEQCAFIPVDTLGDILTEKKKITSGATFPEINVYKERCELTSRIHDSTAENIACNTAVPTLMAIKENQELSAKMIVTEYINKVHIDKLTAVITIEETSESSKCYSGSTARTEKTPDGKVSETKLTQKNIVLTFLQGNPSPKVSEMENNSEGLNSFDEQQDQELSDEKPAREMLIRRQQSDISETSIDKPVLETLTFSASKLTQNTENEDSKSEANMDMCVCPLCDRAYTSDNKDVLAHLVLMHKFVIADVNFIANLPAYLRYWKARFDENPISEFCSKIVTNTGAKDQAPKEEFNLLCDALPEDKSIREHLQRKKLESILAQQQKEREETKFCRQCLFCKQTFCGNRAVLFDHLLRDHTFHVGQPDNLVYTDELFDLIQSKLDNQLCLFCEKSFKDKASLREHMRKKQHRKINPKNKEYDRFYIVNYMEMGKNWESLQSEDNRLVKSSEKDTDEEEEWSGWNEESESKVVCLFCDSSCVVQTDLQQHMKEKHSFDLQEVNNKLQLNFYQKVKLINYIRRQVYHRKCYGCQQVFEDKEKLHSHFDEFSDHIKKIPDAEVWDQPQYFFPTYEDDCLLCQLDDDDEGAAGDALGVMVIAENIPVTDTILKDQKLCHDLLKP